MLIDSPADGGSGFCHPIEDFLKLEPRESERVGLFYIELSTFEDAKIAVDFTFLYRRESNLWSFDARCKVGVVEDEDRYYFEEEKAVIITEKTTSICPRTVNYSYRMVVERHQLSKWVKNNRLNLIVEVDTVNVVGVAKRRELMFLNDQTLFSDVILTANFPSGTPRNFHVSKAVLAAHSPVFHKLFFGPGSDPDITEILIKDVDTQSLHNFLSVIYGARVYTCHILSHEVDGMLKLGERYDVEAVRVFCVKELQSPRVTMRMHPEEAKMKKLQLATKYRLCDLQEALLASLCCLNEVKKVRDYMEGQDHATSAALLDKSLSFVN